jgi:hypothetical protein
MKPLVVIGIVLALIGVVALTYPAFTTTETKNVANVGPVQINKNEEQTHVIPPIASGIVLALGIGLIAGGLLQRPNG